MKFWGFVRYMFHAYNRLSLSISYFRRLYIFYKTSVFSMMVSSINQETKNIPFHLEWEND